MTYAIHALAATVVLLALAHGSWAQATRSVPAPDFEKCMHVDPKQMMQRAAAGATLFSHDTFNGPADMRDQLASNVRNCSCPFRSICRTIGLCARTAAMSARSAASVATRTPLTE